MIELYKTEHLLDDKHRKFAYSKNFLEDEEVDGLKNMYAAEFYFKNDPESREFHAFLVKSLEELLIEQEVYFIHIEKYPQKKNRIRSYRKLFSTMANQLGKENLFETEFDLEDNRTVLTSMIHAISENIPFIIKHLIRSSFYFCYIVEKGAGNFHDSKEIFLEKVLKQGIHQVGERMEENFLKAAHHFANPHASIFRIASDGRDNQYIEFFGVSAHLNKLLSNLEEKVGSNFYLKRMVE